MPAFDDLLNRINLTCYTSMSDANPHPNNSKFILDNPIVIGLSSQIYNKVTHWASHHAGAHDVQKGYITAALAGAWATTPAAKVKAEKMSWYCCTLLPHQYFKHKIDNDNCP